MTWAPAMATDVPKLSPGMPSEASSLAVSYIGVGGQPTESQPSSGSTNTYAEPASLPLLLSSRGTPTTIVSPETATDQPNSSSVCPSEASSLTCSTQHEPSKRKTYAAPAQLPLTFSSSRAPITATSPSMATEYPNQSPAAPSEASSSACSSVGSVPATLRDSIAFTSTGSRFAPRGAPVA